MSSAVPARTDRPSGSGPSAPVAVTTEPKALKRMLASDRPMAWLIIRVSRVPDAPTRVPATMSRLLFEREARRGHGQAGERVEQRDEHGDVGAADGQHEDDPEDERQHQHDDEHGGAGGDDGDHQQGHDGQADGGVDRLLGRVGDGPPGHQLLQLGEGDGAAGERDRPRRARRRGSRRSCRWRATCPAREMNSVTDTSAAAPPPTPLKMATIWGMAVIFTMRAAGTPMTAPMAMATMMRTRFLVWP